MRIAHVEPYFHPDLGYQTYYLAERQVEEGHDVHVITSDRYAPFPDYSNTVYNVLGPRLLTPRISIERGVKVIRLPVSFELASVGQLWLLGLRKTLIKLNPELVFVHGLDTEALRICLSEFQQRPKIVGDCHMVFRASRGGWVKMYYSFYRLFLSKILIRNIDVFVAVSSATKKFMEETLGIPPDRIAVIPLGCDTRLFKRNENSRKELRLRYGISNNDIVFVYAGKIIPEKEPHLLVDAALSLCRKSANIKVMLVGGGTPNYLSSIKMKVKDACLTSNFIFVPLVPNTELYKYYSAADVGVWPAQCSMTMIEAMSCGLPVIISDSSEVKERVEAGNGLLFENGNREDLEDKMIVLLDDKTRIGMAKNARKFAAKYDWSQISDRFIHLVLDR